MKKTFILCALLTMGAQLFAQQSNQFIEDFTELTDGKPHDDASVWAKMPTPVQAQWGDINVRYAKYDVPAVLQGKKWQTKAWKGEKVNAQALFWANKEIRNLSLSVSDLKSGSHVIPASAISAGFLRYVMGDPVSNNGKTACGDRSNKADWDSTMVADLIDLIPERDVEAMSTRPIWVSVRVPQDVKAGKYKGTLTIKGEGIDDIRLQMEVSVLDRVLPPAEDWKFHLDLWQNPYSVARYFNVPLWSREHFEAMRPVMEILEAAGQKVVTATIMNRPWNGQTEDAFNSMVLKTKNLDGSWSYDYTVFDKWVSFMMEEIGIDAQINCYTLIPWALQFDYLDQASNSIKYVHAKPGDAAYADYWGSFLKDFAKHLKAKGWFEKTTIAMDERGVDAMKEAIKVIHAADPDFKISLAGNYYGEVQSDLYDLCVAMGQTFPEDVLAQRKASGKKSTVYTCCAEVWPNTFMTSGPAEAVCFGWHAAAWDYDGYLRWAYNSWTKDPLRDSRFRTWAAGDCYLVYPGGRSSTRLERLIEGIQDFEKIRILEEEFAKDGATKKREKLEAIVEKFRFDKGPVENVADLVKEARSVLNSF